MTTHEIVTAGKEGLPPHHEDEMSSLRCHRADVEVFRGVLPRASHQRDFAAGCVCAYAQSQGLVGLDSLSFSASQDLGDTLSRKLVPTLIRDLSESGFVCKGVMPFDIYLGVFPSPAFLRAVSLDRSILHYVNPREGQHLDRLSPDIRELSQTEVEQRWLKALGSAFLCVSSNSGLSVTDFGKFLPEFEGKEKRILTLLAALHERELITLSNSGGSSEIFLSQSLFEQIHDPVLLEKLRNPGRQPEQFPFLAREVLSLERLGVRERVDSVTAHPQRDIRQTPVARVSSVATSHPKRIEASVSRTDEVLDGNKAGREVRERILRAFEAASTLKMEHLVRSLGDLKLTDANLRYHVSLLCEKGLLTRTGRGRGAMISRSGAA